MEFIIISGLSGAGKSSAASFLEDLGFYCVDNLPVALITSFAGMIAIASALEGYMLRNLNALERILLAAGGLAMLIPGAVTDLIGVGILAAMVVLQLPGRKKTAA